MTNRILMQKLRFISMRIESLKNNLTEIAKNNGEPKGNAELTIMHSNPGTYNFMFMNDKLDFFREWLCRKYDSSSAEYNIEYNLENIEDIVIRYYSSLIWKNNSNCTFDRNLITEFVDAMSSVVAAIDTIVKDIEKEKVEIDEQYCEEHRDFCELVNPIDVD